MSNWDTYGGIKGGDRVDFPGDSNATLYPNSWTQDGYPWYGNPGGLTDQINALLPASVSSQVYAAVSGSATVSVSGNAATVQASTFSRSINVSGYGVAGQTIVDAASTSISLLRGRIPADTISPVIVPHWCVNDIYAIATSAGEVVGDVTTAVNSWFTQLYTYFPHARVAWMGHLAFNEKHTDSPPAWGPGNDMGGTVNVDTVSASVTSALSAAVVANGGIFVDQHAALLTWEITNNQSNAIGGIAAVQNGAGGAAVHHMLVAMTNVAAPAFLAAVPVGT